MEVVNIGTAQLYLGDCLDILKNLELESVDLVCTDPPYLIDYKTSHRKNRNHDFCTAIENDSNPAVIISALPRIKSTMKNNSALYMFCSFDKVDFFKAMIEKHFTLKNMIIWVKNNWTAGDLKAQFGKQYEIIFLANKGRCLINGKRISDVWNFPRVSGGGQKHQNQKPVGLIQLCVQKHSKQNETVLDPFMGSGTTGVACHNLNRKFIGIEKDPKYFAIACERIETAQKQGVLF